MPSIRFRHDNRRVIIPITILPPWPPDSLDGAETTALLDTGATTTGITPRIVDQLNLESLGKRPLGSARGDEQAERYLVRVGLVDQDGDPNEPRFPYIFPEKMVFALKNSFRLDALVGMDILSECDFEMNRDGNCVLRFG
ncbi:aspartyl protease family protein [Parasphingopyxis sp.]|uniref:retroviral-like aspartic protease family protein n=1 Tax=Parasphingopyxis sp. TaxID=1920299 RepID=UPI002634A309|nr:aspartyl protease family protein [Parasphingopyxis sp.]